MSSHTETSHEHAHHHAGEAAVYMKTLTILLILTAITVGAAYINFGAGNVVIALTIASIKATLVALFFMHLRHEKPMNGVIAAAGFLFLAIFLMFDFLDVGTRENLQPVNLKPPLPPPAAAATAGAPGAAPAASPAAAPAAEKK
jgi:cytochrome c oxidase subunit IV